MKIKGQDLILPVIALGMVNQAAASSSQASSDVQSNTESVSAVQHTTLSERLTKNDNIQPDQSGREAHDKDLRPEFYIAKAGGGGHGGGHGGRHRSSDDRDAGDAGGGGSGSDSSENKVSTAAMGIVGAGVLGAVLREL